MNNRKDTFVTGCAVEISAIFDYDKYDNSSNFMPLVACPDCHYKVSDTATLCVNCSRPMKAAKTSYTEKMSALQYQSLKVWVYLGAAILIACFAYKFYVYLFD